MYVPIEIGNTTVLFATDHVEINGGKAYRRLRPTIVYISRLFAGIMFSITVLVTSLANVHALGYAEANRGLTSSMYSSVNDGADALFCILVIIQVLTSRLKSSHASNINDIFFTF